MKTEIKNNEGQVLFTAEPQDNKLNINDPSGKNLCCIEHDGKNLQLKDANNKVITQIESRIKTPVM